MTKQHTETDIILIGAGIMSATLASLLKELAPEWNIKVFERLEKAGEESSNVWNNAGTGHAALCELNYTKEQEDGSIDISKAVNINEKFEVSKQFWSYLVERGLIKDPGSFIQPIPHISFVRGEDHVDFLRKRYEKMTAHPLFEGMLYAEDRETLEQWMPLMMKDRPKDEAVAATKIDSGTDVNFGVLTNVLLDHATEGNVDVRYNQDVSDIVRADDGSWEVQVHNLNEDRIEHHKAPFVFIGSGGGSLHLLQKSGVPEGQGFGGFPVSGQFLVCDNPEVVKQHRGKVYSKAPVGAPPMSVPHLDTRFIDGKETLLFGPFAGFSPKFQKTGSLMDLLNSVRPDNLVTMVAAGAKNVPLTKYLIQQVLLSKEQRVEALREFVPDAKEGDWDLVTAGQRVQILKDTDDGGKGTLQFGTELVTAGDGSLAALLGASPGASTAVSIMLELMEKCFPERVEEWESVIREMVPSYGVTLADDRELIEEVQDYTTKTLNLVGRRQTSVT
ncbi:malate:quinone oxidoreductase [Salimicrobium halophilum]|uniref:Probable malate:quinone oxidoreductase n=1 Tax=Salimicrobium halophilum TaxID=86666 RepID=A0A1G8UZA0_9BACI|nr:malate:quinone oxidoreductase [Salimicrobium halophilum]SDJ58270.1 malate dehydrogenase (quinone) [Salimicrobium halophilum]